MSRNVAILFPGQGSQYEKMGSEFTSGNSIVYRKANNILEKEKLEIIRTGKIEILSETLYCQPAVFLNSMALFEKLDSINLNIKAMAGLSLGEYTALCAGGVISFEDCLKIVEKRAVIMSEAIKNRGSMVAVINTGEEKIKNLIERVKGDGFLSIANLNSPSQTVIGGDFDSIERFISAAESEGIKRIIRLNVEGPFHTDVLKDASESFSEILNKMPYKKSSYNIYSNVDGERHTYNRKDIVSRLQRQMHSPVLFYKMIENMIKDGCDTFIEVGPGKTLSGFVKKIDKRKNVICIEKISDIDKVEEYL